MLHANRPRFILPQQNGAGKPRPYLPGGVYIRSHPNCFGRPRGKPLSVPLTGSTEPASVHPRTAGRGVLAAILSSIPLRLPIPAGPVRTAGGDWEAQVGRLCRAGGGRLGREVFPAGVAAAGCATPEDKAQRADAVRDLRGDNMRLRSGPAADADRSPHVGGSLRDLDADRARP